MSNFDFLQKEWPLVAKLAQTAENYIYDDPNSCLIKLGMLAEQIVSYIVDVNGIVMPEDSNTQADKIRQLKAKSLLPRDIDDILYGLRKARNEAVHANLDSFERACLMLELGLNLYSSGVNISIHFFSRDFLIELNSPFLPSIPSNLERISLNSLK